ncbi:hypothetical protein K504DRAFT_456605 [Pleomassaria siparia CBS 279.74]|uniref:DUF7728 domain-containing protein n=1 Tax=Pleomassaria siparia CBS 279.74 TaxID=1314801 RepID=A0A6G1KNJ6_9PLEO|nr:hypothetical protein K504DRAFT_456605 [Pleomassaria siparia CBS 279.74]
MFIRNFGVFASLALATSAVLIPPSFNADDLGDDLAMETLAVNPFKRTVALDCPGCPFASQDGESLSWTPNAGSHFLLDFEVGAHEDSLNIGGVQLYPPSFGYFGAPFYVTQVNSKSEEPLRLRVTGYTFHYSHAETIEEAGTELLPMTFRITSIESKSVDPSALTINMLKDVNGRLMIASFRSAKAGEGSPIEQEKECQEWPLLCKWKSILSDKVNGIKGSMGKGCHRNKGNPMAQETTHGKPPHRFHPGGRPAGRPGSNGRPHHHPHHPHHQGQNGHHGHRHHSHHRMHMFLRRAFFTIFVPILIGIFAGTLTYLIGMALGCLVAILVAKVRGRSVYESVAQDEDDEGTEAGADKAAYADLPKYDAPPVYEESTEKEVVDETQ